MDFVADKWNRRRFIHTASSMAVLAGAEINGVAERSQEVSLVVDANDKIASSPEAQWATRELEQALTAHGLSVSRNSRLNQVKAQDLCILIAGSDTPLAAQILKDRDLVVPKTPEALAVTPGSVGGRKVILACGHDPRAVVFAMLDLTDRVQNCTTPADTLAAIQPLAELPSNRVRSMTRLFTSDVEDKPWYNDREMWPQYLTMLATQRFNRFNLAFGIGYDFIRKVTDAYFLFTYPFLVAVPGYNVRVPQLSDEERDRNLEMLRFISEQTVARGLEFNIGLWMHGYEWINTTNANYTIEGLTKETHGAYCRDAVRLLLQKCPAISGVTFRVHGESGVQEGSYDFWTTVFAGVATCGREVGIDMHPKGLDQNMIDIAHATNQPVTVSPKFWGEHMGMSYHQADIRKLEQPVAGEEKTGLMKLSTGSRSFLRYGYGDLLREDRTWSVVHRIWPGTQRLLIWGDPITGAAYSRAFSFCGSDGVEICEPLSFKGRRGSGNAGNRTAYLDTTLIPRWDWQKYAYSYRIWGRLLYNSEASPEVWQRYLKNQFGAASNSIEAALASSSRILPIVTTAHAASAGNNTYWPEVYYNQSMVDASGYGPYGDSPAPRVFGNVSPLDPQLFSTINDFAKELLTSEKTGKYSPIQVAQWIEDCAATSKQALLLAERNSTLKERPEYRRVTIDITIQIGLGQFFAAKFRSGVLYGIFSETGDREALQACLSQYRKARNSWAELANSAKTIYMADISIGEEPQQRGHWLDRLPAIDKDIVAVESKLVSAKSSKHPMVSAAIAEAIGRPANNLVAAHHSEPKSFQAGRPLDLQLRLEQPAQAVHMHYRHVDQAERYQVIKLTADGNRYYGTIPATYTNSEYPLEYYFEVKKDSQLVSLYPGFSREHNNQPYFVVRKA
jgi:hypothetical protein